MPITNYGYAFLAQRIGSNVPGIASMGIGSGSGVFDQTRSGLLLELDKQAFTGSYPDYSETDVIKLLSDWSATEVSGFSLREAGLFVGSLAGSPGAIQMSNYPVIVFNATNELQYEVDIQVT